jgi:hypothetical protein
VETLEIIKRETSRLGELRLDEARGRKLVIREIEGELRIQMAPLVDGMRRDQDQVSPPDLKGLPEADLSDQNDRIENVEGELRIRAP